MKVNLEYAKPVSDRYGLCTVICPKFMKYRGKVKTHRTLADE
jgi:hypothetical protein